jgi:hypothetical protein
MHWCLNNDIATEKSGKIFMSTDRLQSNYITRIQTSTDDYPVYHGRILLFGIKDLASMLVPDFFHEVKSKTKYPERFAELDLPLSSDVKVQLWVNSVDKYFDDVRHTISSAILFLHIWGRENPSEAFIEVMVTKYENYAEFFEVVFHHIIKIETDAQIKRIAQSLKCELDEVKKFMGPYHGSLGGSIYPTTEVLAGILSMYCVYTVMSGSSR